MGVRNNSNEWKLTEIGEFGQVFTGTTPSTSDRANYGDNYPFYGPSDLDKSKYLDVAEKNISIKGLSVAREIKEGSILFACIGMIGKMGISTRTCACNQQINWIEPYPEFDRDFIYYALQNSTEVIKNQAATQVVPMINKTEFQKIKINTPSNLMEQKAIAEALSDIDELINILKLEISKLENLVSGYLSEVFKNTEDSQEYRLEDLIKDINDGGTPSTQNKQNFGGNIPWVVIEDISPQIYQTKTTLSDLGVRNSSAIIWPAGTLILSTGATIGEVGVAMTPMATKQGICGIIFDNSKTSTEFMRLWFMKNKSLLESFAQGSTIKEIRPPLIKQLKVTIPNIARQNEIVSKVSDLESNLNSLRDEFQKYEWLKQGMMNDLLTGKVRLV